MKLISVRSDLVARLAAYNSGGLHGTVGAEVLNYCGGAIVDAREAMEDRHRGSLTSLAEYVQELTEETVTNPQASQHNIDWQAMARDARNERRPFHHSDRP